MAMRAKRHEQQQRYLKAKVALELYSAYGRVPKEQEIDHVYHVTRILYRAIHITRLIRKQQLKSGQLALF